MTASSQNIKKPVLFATSNHHKFEEAQIILKEYGVEISHVNAKGYEIQAESIEEIAKVSVKHAFKKTVSPIFVEDAGLFVKALNGFPGPFSSYVYKTIGNSGILKLVKKISDRRAEFRSAVAFCGPFGQLVCFSGVVHGKISVNKHGCYGFGFDPIFIPVEGDGRTFAEMNMKDKNQYSHRARALRSFVQWYLEIYI